MANIKMQRNCPPQKKIRFVTFFAVEDGETLYNKQKQDL